MEGYVKPNLSPEDYAKYMRVTNRVQILMKGGILETPQQMLTVSRLNNEPPEIHI